MIKDAFEDYKRHKSDAEENNKMAIAYNQQTQRFDKKKWANIYPGEIVKIEQDQPLPCDLLILKSSDENGVCYVETKNLDGETNLKIKLANKDIQALFPNEKNLVDIDGYLLCEHPNNAIYKFEGQCKIEPLKQNVPLSVDNILLRGSSLKNTEYIYGISIFTGHDTKIMRNSAKSKYKFSSLEKLMNGAILLILILQMSLSATFGFLGSNWIQENR